MVYYNNSNRKKNNQLGHPNLSNQFQFHKQIKVQAKKKQQQHHQQTKIKKYTKEK